MNRLQKVIVDNKLSKAWSKVPGDNRKEIAVIRKGSAPPGLYSLRITAGNPGGFFEKDQVVQIVADTPEIGYVFNGWSGDNSVVDDPASPITTITMPAHDVDLVAEYILGEYDLVINGGDGDGTYNYNANVPIAADDPPTELETFDVWIGDVAGIVDVNAPDTSIIMPPENVTIQSTYKDIRYDLNVVAGGGDGNYLKGTVVEIIADPPPFGQTFNAWIGDIATIDTPHLPMAHIDLQGNYNIEAEYVNIDHIDPDAEEGYHDVKLNMALDQYDNNYLGNTVIQPDVNRYYDVPDKSSQVRFTSIVMGPNTPGGGLGVFATLPMGTNRILGLTPEQIDGGNYPGISFGPNTPGGGNAAVPGLIIDPITEREMGPVYNNDRFEYPLAYTAYSGYKEIIGDADTFVSNGFAGGELTLTAIRDGSFGNTGIYTTTPVGDNIGVTFPSARTVEGFCWYSLHRGARIEDFTIEYYDGSTWQKIPITSVSSDVSIVNTDEGRASDTNGWKRCYFAPIVVHGIRLVVNSLHAGNTNAGVTELRVYGEETLATVTGFTLSTAGTTLANGDYEYHSEVNGRHAYKHVSENFYIYWDGSEWVISDNTVDPASAAFYSHPDSTAINPPLTGWVVSLQGLPPVPVVAYYNPPPPAAYDYLVSGAGTAWLNGEYTEAGEIDGKPYYQSPDGWFLSFDSSFGGFWCIGIVNSDVQNAYYYSSPGAATPPLNGYTVSLGAAPAPTVSTP